MRPGWKSLAMSRHRCWDQHHCHDRQWVLTGGCHAPGAHDFIAKPVDADRLRVTLAIPLSIAALNALVSRYQNVYPRDQFEGFIGASVSMQEVYHTIETAASRATIFITGAVPVKKSVLEASHSSVDVITGPWWR